MENPVLQAILERRSLRKFEDKTIQKEVMEEIINAGRYAPSAHNTQPWKFIVITNKDMIKTLSDNVKEELKKILKRRFIYQFVAKELRSQETQMMLAGAAMSPKDVIFFDAPALVFIVTQKKHFYDESVACCAENMMLAAHSLGIGSCWIGFAHFLERNKKHIETLGIPEDHHISSVLIFGYPKGTAPKAKIRKVTSNVIKWME